MMDRNQESRILDVLARWNGKELDDREAIYSIWDIVEKEALKRWKFRVKKRKILMKLVTKKPKGE